MKKIIFSVLSLFLATNISFAKNLDLSNISTTNTIYSTEVGGTPSDGVLEQITVTLPAYKRAVIFASPAKDKFNGINQLLPWYTTDISVIPPSDHMTNQPQNSVFFLVLELDNGEYMTIQPISAKEVTSWIEIESKDKINMLCGTLGTESVAKANTPIFAYSKGDDLYGMLAQMWAKILDNEQVKGRTTWRVNKEYSEIYEYLGWCSWEQYKKNINEELLVSAADQIENSDIPIRWILVDDGHQTAKNSALINFEPLTSKFPNGWAPVLAKRSDKIKWFGLWHCMFGLWGGINKDHTMEDLKPYVVEAIKKPYILGEDAQGSKIFYEKLVNSVSQPGFDFTKIDVQTTDFTNYMGKGNPVTAHRQNAENLEAETNAKLSGLMNCMAQNLPCIFNTRYSATTRVSIDYKLNDHKKARSHIYQSFHNSIWMGQTIWPDHDMFHSSDTDLGRFMAVSKAMSAAPIYLSDAPEDFIPEFILPLAYSDGKLLRPLAPGVPLTKSFFANSMMGSEEYSIIAPMTSTSAAIVVYNIVNDATKSLNVSITEQDYTSADGMMQPYKGPRSLPKEGLVYYDWYEKQGGKLNKEYNFTLANLKDRIVLLCEINNGWAVIGREDKYLSTVAVSSEKSSKSSLEFTLHEAGPVLVYSSKTITKASSGEVEALGNNIYRITSTAETIKLQR